MAKPWSPLRSGAEAIEMCDFPHWTIDLLLTDVIMPVMQGPTVANEVRKLRPDIRVLFMSATLNRSSKPKRSSYGIRLVEKPLIKRFC